MQNEWFYRLGTFIYKMRVTILIAWLLLILFCIPIVPSVGKIFKSTGFIANHSTSAKANEKINRVFGFDGNKFIVTYTSKHLTTDNPLFMEKIKASLQGLKEFHIKQDVIYPAANQTQISKDKHSAYAVIFLKSRQTISSIDLDKMKSLIKTPADMKMIIGGEPVFVQGVNKQTQADLFKADYIAAPVTILMMLIIFESIVGAILPVILGAGCALIILTILYFVGSHFSLSVFTLNIALLLGLCLSLDYALFMISRFRYELRNGHTAEVAVAITQATAGKAVFFSGLAVLVSLSALLFFPINILFSVGVGGISAIFIAAATANIVLPAILGMLHTRINFLSIKLFSQRKNGRSLFWHNLVTKVIKRPVIFFVAILSLLLLLSYPLTQIKFGISDYKILPPHSSSRQFFDEFHEKFNGNSLTPIQLIIETPDDILSSKRIANLFELSKKIKQNPYVAEVNSIVTINPHLSVKNYQMLYQMPKHLMTPEMKTLLNATTREHMSLITIVSKYPADAKETKQLIEELQTMKINHGMTATLTGITLSNIEVFNTIKTIFPYAVMAVMVFTYLILLLLLRSLFLPLKAIAMTILSLSASYGMLVFIIQQGHFSQYLHFQAQEMLDVSLLIIIFCALFGFSMDYEVFLLSRIKEQYDKTKKTNNSIVFGVEQSSRIITSAALIVIVICSSFMVADVLMVKAFGLGIAVAIFTDAFLIRSLLVPAIMTLMGKYNWYLPKWLERILHKV